MTSVFDFTVQDINGADVPLERYRGKTLLIVNTASQCGFTPQYQGLEALHRSYGPRGLAILGFPCNQFGHQEPGDAEEIKTFCSLTYDVTFDMFAKIDVNGAKAAPLYAFLKAQAPGLFWTQAIKWNFTKFLIERSGAIRRYGPRVTPQSLTGAIEATLRS